LTARTLQQVYSAVVRSNPEVSRQRRLLAAEILLPLLLIAVAELGLRWVVSRPDSTLWPELFTDPLTTGKYLAFLARVTDDAPLDLLLLGQSQMMRVNAAQMSTQLSAAAGRSVSVFNFAAPFHTVEYDRRILQDILFRLKKPHLIVYSFTPLSLLRERTERETDQAVRNIPAFALCVRAGAGGMVAARADAPRRFAPLPRCAVSPGDRHPFEGNRTVGTARPRLYARR
jgi:hypothetical protein